MARQASIHEEGQHGGIRLILSVTIQLPTYHAVPEIFRD